MRIKKHKSLLLGKTTSKVYTTNTKYSEDKNLLWIVFDSIHLHFLNGFLKKLRQHFLQSFFCSSLLSSHKIMKSVACQHSFKLTFEMVLSPFKNKTKFSLLRSFLEKHKIATDVFSTESLPHYMHIVTELSK